MAHETSFKSKSKSGSKCSMVPLDGEEKGDREDDP